MPTPAAVLEGARLLADGVAGRAGLGALVVVDPGGATTDVHSIGAGEPSTPGVIRYGLPEPHAKRTVEGDLGMRHNAMAIVAAVGLDVARRRARASPPRRATAALARIEADVETVPSTDTEARLDDALVRAAVDIAVGRHAGTVETVYTAQGPVQMQRGKDLSGRAVADRHRGRDRPRARPGVPYCALRAPIRATPAQLRPRAPRLAIDADYLLYAAGLLAQVDPGAAFDCARNHLRIVDEANAMNDHADSQLLRAPLSEAAIPADEFLRAREANLARWPTGTGVDFDAAVARHKALPTHKRLADAMRARIASAAA